MDSKEQKIGTPPDEGLLKELTTLHEKYLVSTEMSEEVAGYIRSKIQIERASRFQTILQDMLPTDLYKYITDGVTLKSMTTLFEHAIQHDEHALLFAALLSYGDKGYIVKYLNFLKDDGSEIDQKTGINKSLLTFARHARTIIRTAGSTPNSYTLLNECIILSDIENGEQQRLKQVIDEVISNPSKIEQGFFLHIQNQQERSNQVLKNIEQTYTYKNFTGLSDTYNSLLSNEDDELPEGLKELKAKFEKERYKLWQNVVKQYQTTREVSSDITDKNTLLEHISSHTELHKFVQAISHDLKEYINNRTTRASRDRNNISRLLQKYKEYPQLAELSKKYPLLQIIDEVSKMPENHLKDKTIIELDDDETTNNAKNQLLRIAKKYEESTFVDQVDKQTDHLIKVLLLSDDEVLVAKLYSELHPNGLNHSGIVDTTWLQIKKFPKSIQRKSIQHIASYIASETESHVYNYPSKIIDRIAQDTNVHPSIKSELFEAIKEAFIKQGKASLIMSSTNIKEEFFGQLLTDEKYDGYFALADQAIDACMQEEAEPTEAVMQMYLHSPNPTYLIKSLCDTSKELELQACIALLKDYRQEGHTTTPGGLMLGLLLSNNFDFAVGLIREHNLMQYEPKKDKFYRKIDQITAKAGHTEEQALIVRRIIMGQDLPTITSAIQGISQFPTYSVHTELHSQLLTVTLGTIQGTIDKTACEKQKKAIREAAQANSITVSTQEEYFAFIDQLDLTPDAIAKTKKGAADHILLAQKLGQNYSLHLMFYQSMNTPPTLSIWPEVVIDFDTTMTMDEFHKVNNAIMFSTDVVKKMALPDDEKLEAITNYIPTTQPRLSPLDVFYYQYKNGTESTNTTNTILDLEYKSISAYTPIEKIDAIEQLHQKADKFKVAIDEKAMTGYIRAIEQSLHKSPNDEAYDKLTTLASQAIISPATTAEILRVVFAQRSSLDFDVQVNFELSEEEAGLLKQYIKANQLTSTTLRAYQNADLQTPELNAIYSKILANTKELSRVHALATAESPVFSKEHIGIMLTGLGTITKEEIASYNVGGSDTGYTPLYLKLQELANKYPDHAKQLQAVMDRMAEVHEEKKCRFKIGTIPSDKYYKNSQFR
jgi:hypothetical protein